MNRIISQKQALVNTAAQTFNHSRKPYERGILHGIEGIKKTPNNGVSFSNTNELYQLPSGLPCIVNIQATGSRFKDFALANKKTGLDRTPIGYVWHHVDDYNVKDNTFTLELVKKDAHRLTIPHFGGCAQYDIVNGFSYNRKCTS